MLGIGLLDRGAATAAPKAFADAVQQYRAGHLSDAFGRFLALANEGDADAARIALFMHQYGPTLYGRYWEASPQDVARWQSLQDPLFQPTGLMRAHSSPGSTPRAATARSPSSDTGRGAAPAEPDRLAVDTNRERRRPSCRRSWVRRTAV